MSKRILSGMQSSGEVHLGNYLGAIKHWVDLQSDNKVIIMVADLHAITVPQEPDALRKRTIELTRTLMACGIDPEQTILFKQSDVPAHAELGYILSSIATMGEMSRMIQYKDKSRKQGADTSSVGLFTYPVLQAADILLYDTEAVPVGEDQRQHIELTRDLAERFNKRFGETFVVPEAEIFKVGARVMSLSDPTRKMSKSDGPSTYVGLLDPEEIISSKVKKAVTTPEGLTSLVSVYSNLSGETDEAISSKYAGKSQEFKEALSDLLTLKLAPIQAKYEAISDEQVRAVLEQGSQKASELANSKLSDVKQKVGLL
jgi:tryptophanyl-tRNA synthetase